MGLPRNVHLPYICTDKKGLKQSTSITKHRIDTSHTSMATQVMVSGLSVSAGERAPSSFSDL